MKTLHNNPASLIVPLSKQSTDIRQSEKFARYARVSILLKSGT